MLMYVFEEGRWKTAWSSVNTFKFIVNVFNQNKVKTNEANEDGDRCLSAIIKTVKLLFKTLSEYMYYFCIYIV